MISWSGSYESKVKEEMMAATILDGRALLQVQPVAALDAGHELVAKPDVGEGAPHHHLVVSPAAPVRAEVVLRDSLPVQVSPGGALLRDVACRGEALCSGSEEGAEHHGYAAFHVKGTSAPDESVFDHASERINCPLLMLCRNYIHM